MIKQITPPIIRGILYGLIAASIVVLVLSCEKQDIAEPTKKESLKFEDVEHWSPIWRVWNVGGVDSVYYTSAWESNGSRWIEWVCQDDGVYWVICGPGTLEVVEGGLITEKYELR